MLTKVISEMTRDALRDESFVQAFLVALEALTKLRRPDDLAEKAAKCTSLVGPDIIAGLRLMLKGLCATPTETQWVTNLFFSQRTEIEQLRE
jgi:hypothetical protein